MKDFTKNLNKNSGKTEKSGVESKSKVAAVSHPTRSHESSSISSKIINKLQSTINNISTIREDLARGKLFLN